MFVMLNTNRKLSCSVINTKQELDKLYVIPCRNISALYVAIGVIYLCHAHTYQWEQPVDDSHHYGVLYIYNFILFISSQQTLETQVHYIQLMAKNDAKMSHVGGSCSLTMDTSKCGHGFNDFSCIFQSSMRVIQYQWQDVDINICIPNICFDKSKLRRQYTSKFAHNNCHSRCYHDNI